MRIVADENIPHLKAYFAAFGEVVPVNGRHLTPEQVAQADVLLVRSVTPVNAGLLENSPVRFVGTCTIGTDHLDKTFLDTAAIAYASAPGCNAGGVVQYDLTALAALRKDWLSLKVGIVGCGNVGGRLYRTLRNLGVNCVGYDPFLDHTSGIDLVSMDEILACDVVCLHAPLTRDGPHPTEHLFNRALLERLKPGALLLNAGRGGVVDNVALNALLATGADLQVVLDVWENEPSISADLAHRVAVATPHIAGYSDEGRVNGSIMICRALANFLEWDETVTERHLQSVTEKTAPARQQIQAESLEHALAQTYDLWGDHQRLMDAVKWSTSLGAAFDRLRKQYPERHEPLHFDVVPVGHSEPLPQQLRAAGFRVVSERGAAE